MSPFEFSRAESGGEPRHGRLEIASVDGREVPGGHLEVDLGPRKIGGRYARVFIVSIADRRHFIEALYNDGTYPGQNWIEVFDLELPTALEGERGWEYGLATYLRPLGEAIPPGGHLMIEYESEAWQSTQRGLLAGIPPLATPLGGVLFDIGCGDSFKDWYFPEGGQEGGRKLQGNRAYTAAQRLEMAARRVEELERFLASSQLAEPGIDGAARVAAAERLDQLRRGLALP